MADQSGGTESRASTTQGTTGGSSSSGGTSRKSGASKNRAGVNRTEAPEGAAEGTPRAVSRWEGAEPGPDVSNADVDLALTSPIAEHSTYVENPDPNPDEVWPAPGPSSVQVLGHANSISEQADDDEPLANKGEESR